VSTEQLTLKVTNDLAAIPQAAAELDAFCSTHALSSRTAHRFNLALEEVLANVIAYAFPAGGRHEIDVRIAHRDGRLYATVTDDGVAFNPLTRPTPDLHAPIEERQVGGLGIHLLRTLTDTADYRRDGDRNVLTFSMRAAGR
jgi:serine/threonine-protein kinase RsbW/sigma-B regulation protein RsbU (phosphoserine phosphatase)